MTSKTKAFLQIYKADMIAFHHKYGIQCINKLDVVIEVCSLDLESLELEFVTPD